MYEYTRLEVFYKVVGDYDDNYIYFDCCAT